MQQGQLEAIVRDLVRRVSELESERDARLALATAPAGETVERAAPAKTKQPGQK